MKDFELLVSLNVFNDSLMNDAIYKFKRYEDSSLEYTGLRMHSKDEDVGLFSTVLSAEDFARMSAQQDSEMKAPKRRDSIADVMAAMRMNAPEPAAKPAPAPTITQKAASQPVRQAYPAANVSTFIGGTKPAAPAVPKADVSGIKVGTKVQHKTFGAGTVVSMNERMVTVRFAAGGTKMLGFPYAFDMGLVKKID